MTGLNLIVIAVGALVLLFGIGATVAVVSRKNRELAAPKAPEAIESPLEVPTPTERADTTGEPAGAEDAPEEAAPTDVPTAPRGRLARLRERLARSQSSLGRGLMSLLGAGDLTEAQWEEIEDTLLAADVGVGPATELVEKLRLHLAAEGNKTPEIVRSVLREELIAMVDPALDRTLKLQNPDGLPGVVLVVGVNGTGKTTTVGRIARVLVAEDNTVVLGAADTFRAAAADQLQTWGERVGASTVRGPEGGDPASVGFDAVKQGIEQNVDVVLVDTAGRLHTKSGLMDELGKIKRVIEKQAPITEVLLVIDATTGQNGLTQARVFADVTNVTGIVLTKLDGTAKGGIVIAVQRELGVPVKFVGLGEGPDDLAPFDAVEFVDALLE
ncbi:MAG: signal recognition particle-docking protein FtsY [Actinomycetales bacterium]|nr:signal recognition particle-docking protein FtsY [Actinomycetales bacterium]